MSSLTRLTKHASVPVGIAAVAAAAVGLGPSLMASAGPGLPPISAEQLLVKVQRAHVDTLSGTIDTRTDLGLPALPSSAGGSGRDEGPSPTEMLTGTHTLRLAVDGPERQRVAVLDQLAERDLVRNGRDVYAYDSRANSVTHWRLPAERPHQKAQQSPTATQLTPQQLAKRFLAEAGPTTQISVDGTGKVAGRSVYTLQLAPKSAQSLVGSVRIGVDSKTGVPLRVTVTPKSGGGTAVDVGFRDVSFSAPPASRFDFTPPKGAKVKEEGTLPARPSHGLMGPMAGAEHNVVGESWTSVLAVDGVRANRYASTLAKVGHPVTGSFGQGRLVQTRLVSALLTDDGHLYVGAVTPKALEAVAGRS